MKTSSTMNGRERRYLKTEVAQLRDRVARNELAKTAEWLRNEHSRVDKELEATAVRYIAGHTAPATYSPSSSAYKKKNNKKVLSILKRKRKHIERLLFEKDPKATGLLPIPLVQRILLQELGQSSQQVSQFLASYLSDGNKVDYEALLNDVEYSSTKPKRKTAHQSLEKDLLYAIQKISCPEFKDCLKRHDVDRDGCLTFSEFKTAMKEVSTSASPACRSLFNHLENHGLVEIEVLIDYCFSSFPVEWNLLTSGLVEYFGRRGFKKLLSHLQQGDSAEQTGLISMTRFLECLESLDEDIFGLEDSALTGLLQDLGLIYANNKVDYEKFAELVYKDKRGSSSVASTASIEVGVALFEYFSRYYSHDSKPMFKDMDVNSSGKISRREFSRFISKKLSVSLRPDAIDSIFDRFDVNHDDFIDYNEFVDLLLFGKQKSTQQYQTSPLHRREQKRTKPRFDDDAVAFNRDPALLLRRQLATTTPTKLLNHLRSFATTGSSKRMISKKMVLGVLFDLLEGDQHRDKRLVKSFLDEYFPDSNNIDVRAIVDCIYFQNEVDSSSTVAIDIKKLLLSVDSWTLRRRFFALDLDGNGSISRVQFSNLLETLFNSKDDNFSREHVENITKQVARQLTGNGDERFIKYSDLMKFLSDATATATSKVTLAYEKEDMGPATTRNNNSVLRKLQRDVLDLSSRKDVRSQDVIRRLRHRFDASESGLVKFSNFFNVLDAMLGLNTRDKWPKRKVFHCLNDYTEGGKILYIDAINKLFQEDDTESEASDADDDDERFDLNRSFEFGSSKKLDYLQSVLQGSATRRDVLRRIGKPTASLSVFTFKSLLSSLLPLERPRKRKLIEFAVRKFGNKYGRVDFTKFLNTIFQVKARGGDMLQKVQQENKQLKSELSAFDQDFFEQVEDLKYSYKAAVERNKQLEDHIWAQVANAESSGLLSPTTGVILPPPLDSKAPPSVALDKISKVLKSKPKIRGSEREKTDSEDNDLLGDRLRRCLQDYDSRVLDDMSRAFNKGRIEADGEAIEDDIGDEQAYIVSTDTFCSIVRVYLEELPEEDVLELSRMFDKEKEGKIKFLQFIDVIRPLVTERAAEYSKRRYNRAEEELFRYDLSSSDDDVWSSSPRHRTNHRLNGRTPRSRSHSPKRGIFRSPRSGSQSPRRRGARSPWRSRSRHSGSRSPSLRSRSPVARRREDYRSRSGSYSPTNYSPGGRRRRGRSRSPVRQQHPHEVVLSSSEDDEGAFAALASRDVAVVDLAKKKLHQFISRLGSSSSSSPTKSTKPPSINLKKAFNILDPKLSGRVSFSKLLGKSKALEGDDLELESEQERLELVLSEIDPDDVGFLTYDAFLKLFAKLNSFTSSPTSPQREVIHDRIKKTLQQDVFQHSTESSDSDEHRSKGTLSRLEFHDWMDQHASVPLSEREKDDLFSTIDTNQNGRISYAELKRFAQSTSEAEPTSNQHYTFLSPASSATTSPRIYKKEKIEFDLIVSKLRALIFQLGKKKQDGEEIVDLKRAFGAFDISRRGVLSGLDFRRVLRKLGFHLTREEETKLLNQVAKKKDTIDFPAFVAFYKDSDSRDESPDPSPRQRPTDEMVEAVVREKVKRLAVGPSFKRQFNRFDRDKTGDLSLEEFVAMLSSLHLSPSHRSSKVELTIGRIRSLFNRINSSSTGYVSYEEFQSFVNQPTPMPLSSPRDPSPSSPSRLAHLDGDTVSSQQLSSRYDGGPISGLTRLAVRKLKSTRANFYSLLKTEDLEGKKYLQQTGFEVGILSSGVKGVQNKELDSLFQKYEVVENQGRRTGEVFYPLFLVEEFLDKGSLLRQFKKKNAHCSDLGDALGKFWVKNSSRSRKNKSLSRRVLKRALKQLGVLSPEWHIDAAFDVGVLLDEVDNEHDEDDSCDEVSITSFVRVVTQPFNHETGSYATTTAAKAKSAAKGSKRVGYSGTMASLVLTIRDGLSSVAKRTNVFSGVSKVSERDLLSLLQRRLSLDVGESDVKVLFKLLDEPGRGYIPRKELLALLLSNETLKFAIRVDLETDNIAAENGTAIERVVRRLLRSKTAPGEDKCDPRLAFRFLDRSMAKRVYIEDLVEACAELGHPTSNCWEEQAFLYKAAREKADVFARVVQEGFTYGDISSWLYPPEPRSVSSRKIENAKEKVRRAIRDSSKKGGGSTDLAGIFRRMDRTGKGYLTRRELSSAVQQICPELLRHDLKKLVNSFGADSITLSQFRDVFG